MNKTSHIWDILDKELDRQEHTIELIASENYPSDEVLAAVGTRFALKYTEGYPSKESIEKFQKEHPIMFIPETQEDTTEVVKILIILNFIVAICGRRFLIQTITLIASLTAVHLQIWKFMLLYLNPVIRFLV